MPSIEASGRCRRMNRSSFPSPQPTSRTRARGGIREESALDKTLTLRPTTAYSCSAPISEGQRTPSPELFVITNVGAATDPKHADKKRRKDDLRPEEKPQ